MTTAIAARPASSANTMALYAPDAIQATMSMAKALVGSRLTPRGVDTPEKAFYIIMKGRELGVPPIRALERIHIIEGKTCMAAELMLERFRQRGGHSKWVKNTAAGVELWLKAPNGDEHTEEFTMDDARAAGVAGKDNWRKWPKAMLRARAAAAGLRAMGEAEGMYDPDELGAVTNEDGEVVAMQAAAVAVVRDPKAPAESAAPSAEPAVSGESSVASYTAPPSLAKTGVMRLADETESDEQVNDEYTEMVPIFDPATGEEIGQRPAITAGQNKHIHVLLDKCGHHMDVPGKPGERGKYRKKLREKFTKDSTDQLATHEASWAIEWLLKCVAKLERAMGPAADLREAFDQTAQELGTDK